MKSPRWNSSMPNLSAHEWTLDVKNGGVSYDRENDQCPEKLTDCSWCSRLAADWRTVPNRPERRAGPSRGATRPGDGTRPWWLSSAILGVQWSSNCWWWWSIQRERDINTRLCDFLSLLCSCTHTHSHTHRQHARTTFAPHIPLARFWPPALAIR